MAKISSIDGASRSQSVLQTFKFTIYSIIVHYKYRVFPNLYELGGQKFFFARFAREFTILYPPLWNSWRHPCVRATKT